MTDRDAGSRRPGFSHPLSGRKVLVTRSPEQAAELSGALRELGADVVETAAIEIRRPRSWAPVDRAIARIDSYDWVIFTSANGVQFFASRLVDAGSFGRARIAAIGPGTGGALARLGIPVDLVPRSFTTAAVGRAFPRGRGRVLLARADVAEADLESVIESKGWTVDRVTAYRILPVRRLSASMRSAVLSGEIDVVTFASAGTVRAFLGALEGEMPGTTKVACIGPVTAKAARAAGLRVDAVAAEHTIAGLAAAVVTAAASPAKRRRAVVKKARGR